MKRILLVVDLSNLYYCVKRQFNGGRLDYAKVLAFLKRFGVVHRAIAYGADIDNQAQAFRATLEKLGFETKYKTPRRINGEITKANVDVDLAIDVARMTECVDVVVFGSADGDFVPAMEYVKSHGREAWVLACGISKESRDAATRCLPITEDFLKSDLGQTGRGDFHGGRSEIVGKS